MIDDDDDEERKLLVKDLQKKGRKRRGVGCQKTLASTLPVSLNASSSKSTLPLTLDAGMYIVRISNEKGEKILRVWKP